jgi:hypothetical protein
MLPVFLNLSAWKAPLVFSLMPRSDLVEVGYYATVEKKNEEKKFANFIALVPWTNQFLAGAMGDISNEKLNHFQKTIQLRTHTIDFGTLFAVGENLGFHTDLYYRKETTKYKNNIDSDLIGFISNAVWAFNPNFSLGVGVSFTDVKPRKTLTTITQTADHESSFFAALGYVIQSGKFRTEGWLPGNAKASYEFSDFFSLTFKYKLRSSKFFLGSEENKPSEGLSTLRRTNAFLSIIPEFLIANHIRLEPHIGTRIIISEKFNHSSEFEDNFSKKFSAFALGQVSFKF